MPKEKRTRAEWLNQITNRVEMTEPLREVISGVLLSDGSIHRVGQRSTASLRIMQSPTRRGWLQQVSDSLGGFGVVTRLDSVFRNSVVLEGHTIPEGEYDLLRSLNYVEFVGERYRWYPDGKKVVPRDLRLTPVTLCHWFCGDGNGGDSKGTLGFCTDGFSVEDVDFLVERLWVDLGVYSTRVLNHRGHPKVLVGRRDEAVKIQTLLGPLLPQCCLYKLKWVHPLQSTGKGRRLPREVLQNIRRDRFTCTMSEAAIRHGVSVSKVWKVWHE